jgi:hypothetical protein
MSALARDKREEVRARRSYLRTCPGAANASDEGLRQQNNPSAWEKPMKLRKLTRVVVITAAATAAELSLSACSATDVDNFGHFITVAEDAYKALTPVLQGIQPGCGVRQLGLCVR